LYSLELSKSSLKDLKKIDKHNQVYILDSLEEFISNFDNKFEISMMQSGKIKKLKGQDEELFRLKLRSYRVIYKKVNNKLVILVLHITTRENAY
jgi:mRNA interferase RelE/StbE